MSCVPAAVRVGVLVNPATSPLHTVTLSRTLQAAALSIGLQIDVLEASTGRDIDTAFATLAQKPIDALFVGPGPLLQQPSRATRHAGGSPQDACDLSLA